MEDRYEIREKIGQGGIGSVHRAYDHKMGRQVAIKRILTSSEDSSLEDEATKQMMAEVGALASLQHPHIVTVYDVGSDEDGPFVVMELINGQTLDEIAENAPLTWEDFKIVAEQSLEALLAAHDLEMIHSDLKPPNIMLAWMPSGAFQIKIVDFGLATMIHNQSQEEIEKMDAVYGSVFFMPPEQFERRTLDARSDLYSLGCCFYQALTGAYPFNGNTGMEVMQAHLDHAVRPIQEIRDDIPPWACDWVMWMINRYPDDRPPSAREALANFVQNDRAAKEVVNRQEVPSKQSQIISSSDPPSASDPVPTTQEASTGHGAAAPTASHSLGSTGLFPTTGAHTGSVALGKKKPINKLLWITIPAAAALLIVSTVWLMKRNEGIRQSNAYDKLVSLAAQTNVRQVHLNGEQLDLVFHFIVNSKPDADLAPAYAALNKATALDGSDIDSAIAAFATTANLPGAIRRELFVEVIRNRKNAAAVPILIKYGSSAGDAGEAIAAFDAIRPMIREEHAEGILGIMAFTDHVEVRQAAEAQMSEIIARSSKRVELAALISKTSTKTVNPSARQHLDRLLEQLKPRVQTQAQARPAATQNPIRRAESRGPDAQDKVMESFNASDEVGKIKIIAELGRTPEGHSHAALRGIATSPEHAHLQTKAIQALIELNTLPGMYSNERTLRQQWVRTIWSCGTDEQKIMVIDALAKYRAEWATILIEELSRGRETPTILHARKILEELK